MSARAEALLERRLLIVSGKGGTGKTSVAAALGVLSARTGRRTLVVEVGHEAEIPVRFEADADTALDHSPLEVAENVFTLRISPLNALKEYLATEQDGKILVQAVKPAVEPSSSVDG